MLNILGNIDPVNYIIQDVLQNIMTKELMPKNNFFVRSSNDSTQSTSQSESTYALDIMQLKKNTLRLRIRTGNLQDLCNIQINKNTTIIRYCPEFYIIDQNEILSSNLFSDKFSTEELESTFERNLNESAISATSTDSEFVFNERVNVNLNNLTLLKEIIQMIRVLRTNYIKRTESTDSVL